MIQTGGYLHNTYENTNGKKPYNFRGKENRWYEKSTKIRN